MAVWVADTGVLSKPAPEYPLLHEGTADVFRGVPGGISPARRRTRHPDRRATTSWSAARWARARRNACRVVMLGCALDPLAELDVFVFANNGDFDAYRPRLARYVKGVEDDAIAAAVQRLHELYAEVGRREGRLADLGAKKVTRQLAQDHRGHAPDRRPVQRVPRAVRPRRVRRDGRRAGHQDDQAGPQDRHHAAVRHPVQPQGSDPARSWSSWSASTRASTSRRGGRNDGFLGDGSFAAGIRATELRPGRDRGTSLITGVSEAQFELLRWYFVEVDDDTGFDAAADVIARAVAAAAPGTPSTRRAARAPIEAPRPARRPGRGARRRARQAPRRCRACCAPSRPRGHRTGA